MNIPRTDLPAYALPYQSPAYGSEKDIGAEFYGDDKDTISVAIERAESGALILSFTRSGLTESQFSRAELAHVMEVLNALHRHLKIRNPKSTISN